MCHISVVWIFSRLNFHLLCYFSTLTHLPNWILPSAFWRKDVGKWWKFYPFHPARITFHSTMLIFARFSRTPTTFIEYPLTGFWHSCEMGKEWLMVDARWTSTNYPFNILSHMTKYAPHVAVKWYPLLADWQNSQEHLPKWHVVFIPDDRITSIKDQFSRVLLS